MKAVADALGIEVKHLAANDSEEFNMRPEVDLIPRIKSGRELCELVGPSNVLSHDGDELETREEMELLKAFFQDVTRVCEFCKEWDPVRKIEHAFELSEVMKELEQAGFYVFAESSNRHFYSSPDSLGGEQTWDLLVATILVIRRTHPAIVQPSESREVVAVSRRFRSGTPPSGSACGAGHEV